MIRVLIIDDAPGFRQAVRGLLERRGYAIAGEATTAVAALSAIEALHPDAVLLDVHLPDRDGFDLAAELRRTWPRLSVLMTSTDFDDCYYSRAREIGASGYVPKTLLSRAELTRFWSSGPSRT